MTHHLKSRDIIALGFMTFALFVGAGNIIFPPMVGLQAGEHVWTAAFGFLLTAVGLPVLTVIALAKVGGGVDSLSTPIGKVAGVLLATVCYLAVGPLFATPRTATVSFEVGIAPLTGDGAMPLFIYSLIYFAIVILVSLYPGKLLDTVGNFLAPLKIVALIVLAYSLFRSYSKNIAARDRENATFERIVEKPRKQLSLMRKKWTNRKTTRYFKCKGCGQVLSVPRGKGTLRVVCPKCKTETKQKS